MRTPSAAFDRRIAFLKPVRTKDPRFNSTKKDWIDHVSVFAQVRDVAPAREEQIVGGIDVRQQPCRIRIRWRADITADMRIRYGAREMEIVGGPTELGRREVLELLCQEVSTLGDGA